jgi:hypothetical protein
MISVGKTIAKVYNTRTFANSSRKGLKPLVP